MSFHEFDAIAEQWDSYKRKPSPSMRFALELVRKGDIVLDAGCGSGNNALAFASAGAHVSAIDASKEMVRIAQHNLKGTRSVVLEAQVEKMPFHDDYFDSVHSLAVLHHLESHAARLQALKEMRRVLRPEGSLFLTVWNHAQERLRDLPKDARVPWRLHGSKVLRYYHFFDHQELCALMHQAGFRNAVLFYERNGLLSQKEEAHNVLAVALK